VVHIKPARIALFLGGLLAAQLSTSAYAQEADPAVNEYTALLDQIQNVKIATMQRRAMMETQKSTMESLRSQIASVPGTKSSIRGIAVKMVAEIEKVIESDLPFRKEERAARLDAALELVNDDTSSDAAAFSRAMTLYDVEVNYGYTISSYTGNHPLNNDRRRLNACRQDLDSSVCNLSKETREKLDGGYNLDGTPGDLLDISEEIKDGNYVHFGRMSFIYLDLDSREGFRWSKETGGWEPLESRDIINARRSVRIARGESAPGVVTAPVNILAAQ